MIQNPQYALRKKLQLQYLITGTFCVVLTLSTSESMELIAHGFQLMPFHTRRFITSHVPEEVQL